MGDKWAGLTDMPTEFLRSFYEVRVGAFMFEHRFSTQIATHSEKFTLAKECPLLLQVWDCEVRTRLEIHNLLVSAPFWGSGVSRERGPLD
jgi:hypothetical protein